MKKYLLLSFAMIGLTLSSCSDFLDEDNRSNVVAEEYYLTSEGYDALVNANYSKLREIYGEDPYLFTAGTDIMAVAQGRGNEPEGLSQYTTLNPSSQSVGHLYASCYKAIQAANTAIHYGDITEETNVLSERIGEMKYLRANAYFLLVQTYGDVSIIEDLVNEPILSWERNQASEVYDLIISDLEDALSRVSSSSFMGRVNKRAVDHLLAKVYLTRGYEDFGSSSDFTMAAQHADAAIAGQGLSESFEDIWTPGNELNSEVLFSVQYSAGSISADPENFGNAQQYYFGSYLGGDEVSGDAPYRSYTLIATEFAQKLFEEGDERWEGTFMTEIYSRYYDYFDAEDRSTLPVRDFYEPSWFTVQDSIDFVTTRNLAPDFEYHKWGTHWAKGVSGDFETISVKKFDDPNSLFGINTSSRDIILSRLGDTYLLAAEAYFKAGNGALALDRLNEVRGRAGVANATSIDIDFILDERARELFGEYHRWFDLKRTEKLVERASMHNYLIEAGNFQGAGGELKILRPIPQDAIDLNQNKNFKQNPAYN